MPSRTVFWSEQVNSTVDGTKKFPLVRIYKNRLGPFLQGLHLKR